MTTKPTAKVRKAFELLRKHADTMSVKEACERAGCSRSAIYRSSLFADYQKFLSDRKRSNHV